MQAGRRPSRGADQESMAVCGRESHLNTTSSPMKFRSEPIDVSADRPFAFDTLERQPVVEFLENFIASADGPLVLAIDAPWGSGKTAVVKMLQVQLEKQKFRTLYFNAWAVDYASDPLVALVSKVDLLAKEASADAKKRVKRMKSITTLVAKRGLIAGVKAATFGALDLDKEMEAVLSQSAADASADLFDLVVKEGECLAKFREELEEFVKESKQEDEKDVLVFFIDELDRCRPSFSIELLERIKHLFDVENVIFVLSIDKVQLEVSVSSVYGAGINAQEYLRRFVDLEFHLPQPSRKQFSKSLITRFGLDNVFAKRTGSLQYDAGNFMEAFDYLVKAGNLSLRTQEQCIARLALVMAQLPSNEYLYPILAATLLVVRAVNRPLYTAIRSGASSTEELIAWLETLGAPSVATNRAAIMIEVHMNAADPDEARYMRRMHALEEQANRKDLDGTQAKYAGDMLAFTNQVRNGFEGCPQLNHLLQKIDLTEKVLR
jgi:KAP family P-loop domain